MRDKVAVVLLSFLVNLPFVETVLHYAIINRRAADLREAIAQLPPGFVPTTVAVAVAGWMLMLVAFLANPLDLRKPLEYAEAKVQAVRTKINRSLGMMFLVVPAVFLLVFGFNLLSEDLKKLLWSKTLESGVLILLWVFVGVLAWYVNQLLRALQGPLPKLRNALADWSLSIKVSVTYYVVLAGFAWYAVSPSSLDENTRVSFYFAFTKDLFLMWIIAQLLFVGLFKLARHGTLLPIFSSVRGFTQFILVCGIIAILAIWGDFNLLATYSGAYPLAEKWRKSLLEVHTYTRDIALLLAPIAGLLVWTLNRVGEEFALRQAEEGKARPPEDRSLD